MLSGQLRNVSVFGLLTTLLLLAGVLQARIYRWVLIENHVTDLCNSQLCGNRVHTVCEEWKPHQRCTGFETIHMSNSLRQTILNGHNGLRNKCAKAWKVSNMLYLTWDRDLALMAAKHVQKCLLAMDECDFIYLKSYTVGQNYGFVDGPTANWVSSILRMWYLESRDVHNLDELMERRPANYTQMIWPSTMFVGCATAEQSGGFFLVCNYSPKATYHRSDFNINRVCSSCPSERATCSRIFTALCGQDILIPSKGSRNQFNVDLPALLALPFFIIFYA